MPFPEKIRDYWLEVADNKCQYEIYTEEKGFKDCGRTADHTHHIEPEGWQRVRGGDPDSTTGLALCRHHHMNYEEATLEPLVHTRDFSFHPDMGKAFSDYKSFRDLQRRVYLNLGTGAAKSMKTPFQEEAEVHREKAARGERYWASPQEVDNYYEDKMLAKAVKYNAENGVQKPVCHRTAIFPKPRPTNWEWSRDLFDEKNTK